MKEASVKKERKHRIILYIIIGILSAGLGISLYGNLSSDYLCKSDARQHLGQMTFELPNMDGEPKAEWKLYPKEETYGFPEGVLSIDGESHKVVWKGYSEWSHPDTPVYLSVRYGGGESIPKKGRVKLDKDVDIPKQIKDLKVGKNKVVDFYDMYWWKAVFKIDGTEYVIELTGSDDPEGDLYEWYGEMILQSIKIDKTKKDEYVKDNRSEERDAESEYEYAGPDVDKLISYDIPEGFSEWSRAITPNGSAFDIDYAKDLPGDKEKAPCLSVKLLKYKGKGVEGIEGTEGVTLDEYMKDWRIEQKIVVDGRVGYVTEVESEKSEYRTGLDFRIEYDGSWYQISVSDENDKKLPNEYEKAFYKTINSVRFKK